MVIELIVKRYLEDKVDTPVLLTKPTDQSIKDYCLIEKTGGAPRKNFLNKSMLIIQSYGETMYNAAMLNDLVKDEMQGNGIDKFGIASETEISRCECNNDYNFTDTTKKEYRYQAVFDLYY